MADSVNDVVIAANTWIDLYSATSITVGTAVTVYNKGTQAGQLAIKATSPGANTAIGVPLFTGDSRGATAAVSAGASGLWFYCDNPRGTILSVQS